MTKACVWKKNISGVGSYTHLLLYSCVYTLPNIVSIMFGSTCRYFIESGVFNKQVNVYGDAQMNAGLFLIKWVLFYC